MEDEANSHFLKRAYEWDQVEEEMERNCAPRS